MVLETCPDVKPITPECMERSVARSIGVRAVVDHKWALTTSQLVVATKTKTKTKTKQKIKNE